MKKYDVDDEFEILYRILDSLREYDQVTKPFNRKCIAYISEKISNLMSVEPSTTSIDSIEEKFDDSFDPYNPPPDYMDGAIPATDEIKFVPDDPEYEFYSASMDDVIKPKQSRSSTMS